jgi:hypothetical protein
MAHNSPGFRLGNGIVLGFIFLDQHGEQRNEFFSAGVVDFLAVSFSRRSM